MICVYTFVDVNSDLIDSLRYFIAYKEQYCLAVKKETLIGNITLLVFNIRTACFIASGIVRS